MIIAKWREGFNFYNGIDAQTVAEEITSIGDAPTPQEIVKKGEDENTELHKCFEWNNDIAAEKYRITQARHIIRNLVIEEREVPKDRPEIRVFFKPAGSPGYEQTKIIIKDDDKYERLLKQAYAELRAFKVKYSCLQELAEIFELID